MAAVESERFAATLTALRGLIMIAAAIVAFMFPEQTVTFLVLAGGGLLLVDGALGLATLSYSGPRDTAFWFTLVRNALSIIAGLLVLSGSFLLTIFTLSFLAGLVGTVAVLVGIMEILSTMVGRGRRARLWPVLLGGGLYIVFGLALAFIPLSSAVTLVRVIMVLLVLYGLSL